MFKISNTYSIMKKVLNSPDRGLKEENEIFKSVVWRSIRKFFKLRRVMLEQLAKEDGKISFPFCIVTNFLIATKLSEFDCLSMV